MTDHTSERDRFAAAALPSCMESDYGLDWGKANERWPEKVAAKAYRVADAMMAERAKALSPSNGGSGE